MNNMKFKTAVLLLLGTMLRPVLAQEAVITVGGDASSSDGTVAYSIGQIVYTTIIGTNGSVAQGVSKGF